MQLFTCIHRNDEIEPNAPHNERGEKEIQNEVTIPTLRQCSRIFMVKSCPYFTLVHVFNPSYLHSKVFRMNRATFRDL